MRYLILLTFLPLFQTLAGQTAKPAFATRAEAADVLLEARGGLAFSPGRGALNPRETAAGIELRPGLLAGLSVVLPPSGTISGVFGVDYVRDRGVSTSYVQSTSNPNFPGQGELPDRMREGELQFTEDFVRIRFGGRVHFNNLYLTFGILGALPVRARYDFAFTQTTSQLQDFDRGVSVELAEPIVTESQITNTTVTSNFAVGLSAGFGYCISDRLDVYTRLDRTFHLAAPLNKAFTFRRTRLDIGVGYRLAYL